MQTVQYFHHKYAVLSRSSAVLLAMLAAPAARAQANAAHAGRWSDSWRAFWLAQSTLVKWSVGGLSLAFAAIILGGGVIGYLIFNATGSSATASVRWGYFLGSLLWAAVVAWFLLVVLAATSPFWFVVAAGVVLIIAVMVTGVFRAPQT